MVQFYPKGYNFFRTPSVEFVQYDGDDDFIKKVEEVKTYYDILVANCYYDNKLKYVYEKTDLKLIILVDRIELYDKTPYETCYDFHTKGLVFEDDNSEKYVTDVINGWTCSISELEKLFIRGERAKKILKK